MRPLYSVEDALAIGFEPCNACLWREPETSAGKLWLTLRVGIVFLWNHAWYGILKLTLPLIIIQLMWYRRDGGFIWDDGPRGDNCKSSGRHVGRPW